MAQINDASFFYRPAEQVNPIAAIVKHMAGNLVSRWTDFLTADGEKPTRNRDAEFGIESTDTRAICSRNGRPAGPPYSKHSIR